MTYTPRPIQPSLVAGGVSGVGTTDRELSQRIRVLSALNPYMAQNPDALSTLAQQPYDTETMVQSAGQMYAMQVGDGLANQLRGLSGASQRAIVNRLSPNQRAALGSMGYQPPNPNQGGFLHEAVNIVEKPLGVISKGAGAIPGVKPLFNDVMGSLNWLSNWPGHLYRATVVNTEDDPMAVLAGAFLGAAAIGLAPVTGGASLATLGVLAAGALAGGTAASILTSSPTDWARAFNASWDGERTFRPGAVARVQQMLTDARMSGAAQDLAEAGLDVVKFAQEMAGQRDVNQNSELMKIRKLASGMAEEGSEQWTSAVQSMVNALGIPEFQKAVGELAANKISVGRDFAEAVGLPDGTPGYNVISGAIDGIMLVAVDPTLMLGYANKAWKSARYTFAAFDSAEAATEFNRVVKARPSVMRTYNNLANAVNHAERGGVEILRATVPAQLRPLYAKLVDHRQLLIDQGVHRAYTGDDVIEYFIGQTNMRPVLEGFGGVKNARGVQLVSESYPKAVFRKFGAETRAFIDGVADISTEAKLKKLIKLADNRNAGDGLKYSDRLKQMVADGMPKQHAILELMNEHIMRTAQLYGDDVAYTVPTWLEDRVATTGLAGRPWLFSNQLHPGAYYTGRQVAGIARTLPYIGRSVGKVGEFLTAATTMSIRSKAISLVGHESASEIRAFAELGRYMGLPSYYRKVWTDVMLSSKSPAARYHAMHGYIGNMLELAGLGTTKEGSAIVREYLQASRKLYGANDELLVNGHKIHTGLFLNEQADKVIMPNLYEVRRAAITGGWGKMIGVADLPIIEPLLSKVWKPAVLMRIGFIPRAAGEELFSFMLRGGLGSLAQEFGSRFVGTRDVVAAAKLKGLQELTTAEKALLGQGRFAELPAHIKPLARMLARGNWEDPVMTKMLGYSRWLAEHLRSGLGHEEFAYGRFNRELTERSAFGVHNLQERANTIFLGSEYSMRRMLAGGISDDKLRAARRWGEEHATTVMREASAINAGPMDPGYDHTKIYKELETDPKTLELRPVMLVNERGVRQTLARGDRNYANAMHENWQRPLADPANRSIHLNVTSRIKGGANVDDVDILHWLDQLTKQTSQPATLRGRSIVTEFLGDFRRDHFDEMVKGIDKGKHGSRHVRAALENMPQGRDLTMADVIEQLDNTATDLKIADFPTMKAWQNAKNELTRTANELRSPRVGKVVDYLETLDPASRGFAAQLLHGHLVSGPESPYRVWKASGTTKPFLYHDLRDAWHDQVQEGMGIYRSAKYHDDGMTETLRGLKYDDNGQFVDTDLRNASINLFTVPDIVETFDPSGREDVLGAFNRLLAMSRDKELIARNRETVLHLMRPMPWETPYLVDDYRLARELHDVNARAAGLGEDISHPMMLREDRKLLQRGTQTYAAGPKDADGVVRSWQVPDVGMIDDRLEPVTKIFGDPTAEFAEDSVGIFNDRIRRGQPQFVRFKGRTVEEGAPQESLVYRWNNGKPTPVGKDEELSLSELNRLVDYNGDPIHYGDSKYTGSAIEDYELEPSGNIMWEGVSNAFRDAWDDHAGVTRYRQKEAKSQFSLPGRPQQSLDLVTMPRSTPIDIDKIPLDDRPSHAISEVMSKRKVGKWEQVVNYGFDRVIGPAIDAIVRRPMAFHHFSNRYTAAEQALKWTLDPGLETSITRMVGNYLAETRGAGAFNPDKVAESVKAIVAFDGDANAVNWSANHAFSYLRGHETAEIDQLLARTVARAGHSADPGAIKAGQEATKLIALRNTGTDFSHVFARQTDMATVIDALETALPSGILRDPDRIKGFLRTEEGHEVMRNNPLVRWIDHGSKEMGPVSHWDDVSSAYVNLSYHRKAAGEIAATAAITDVLPFIDSHEFKTQFADHARGFIPFWYAEENFMKRWGRGLMDEGASMVRKAQLTYMGIKQAGIIRTDEQGRDWFVYPGSGLLFDVVGRIPGLQSLREMGIMFQTPTDQMLPGLNNRWGVPSFSPLVTIPLDLVTTMFPELAPAERAALGDFSSGQGAINQLIPAQLRNIGLALTGDAASSARYSSAMMTAIAYAEAHGQGPGDDATPGEVDAFMDQIRRQARIVVMVQALGGFIVPGAPSEIAGGSSANLAGVNVEDAGQYLSANYLQLVRTLGVEDGTAKFLELYPEEGIDGIVNPLAYTIPKNVSVTGAPIPSTEAALSFIDDNATYFGELPNAAPWLIPASFDDDRSQYAFDQQVADGLRQRRTPDEYFTAMKFKMGAQEYFKTRDTYNDLIADAVNSGQRAEAQSLKNQMDYELEIFKAAHPTFADQLQSSDGRERRSKVIREMRDVVDDPRAPESPQLGGIRLAMHAFDRYSVRLGSLQNDHTVAGRKAVDNLKGLFQTYIDQLLVAHPEISSFWVSILKPEANLS